ncbi:hypothetical protein [Massilia aquatica]|uniref:Uncharacterized protein n=1 Tax=Massilia aquatica TaxID=2609000 RepID=A0ABX0MJV4_9BURK|nr:hypothetical protein [Massilia aquatica]NHZ43744.1 hypothetical protein [Massilia aquatica]
MPSLLPDEPSGAPVLSGILPPQKPPVGDRIGKAVAWGGGALALAALIGGGLWFNSQRKLDNAMEVVALSAKADAAARAKPVVKPEKAVVPLAEPEPAPDYTSPPPGTITPAPEKVPPLVVLPPEPEAAAAKKPVEPVAAPVVKAAPAPKPAPKPTHPLATSVLKKTSAAKPVVKAKAPVVAPKKPVVKAKAPVKPGAKKVVAPAPAKAGAKKRPVAAAPAKPGVKPKVAPKPGAKPAAKPAAKPKPAPAKVAARQEPAFKLHTPAGAKPCTSGGLAREC